MRADLTRHILELDGGFHGEHGAGELIERIDGDVAAIADFFARFVVQLLGSGVFVLGVLILLFGEDWRIGGLLSVCVAAAVVFMARGGGFVSVRSRHSRGVAADLTSFLEEHLGALPDLKSNGADDHALRGLLARLGASFRATHASVLAGSMFNAVVGVIFVLGACGALGLSATLYGASVITLGGVYAVFRYTSMLRQPLERLMRQMNNVQTAMGGVARVQELLATPTRVENGRGVPLPVGALAVELRQVSFAYATEPVLRGVSCRVEPGEVLGLLGRTGSGKTTISRLLFRLHDPIEGSVSLGHVDLRDTHLDVLRAHVGLVTQDVQLFHGSLRDNVALFDSSITDERLLHVFADLDLAEWLRTLPAGLDTLLGPRGRGLSAGEAQLVALARVFLKDPG